MAGKTSKTPAKGQKAAAKRVAAKPKLLSGGNPQIAKAYGDAPVQAYITAMPGWKRDVGRRLDALIVRAVPGVRKAVKWNSPFDGVEDQGWFLSFHCFTKYVKVAFFRGASLKPLPPGASKQKHVRYPDIHQDDELDEAQFTAWVKQASRCPAKKCERDVASCVRGLLIDFGLDEAGEVSQRILPAEIARFHRNDVGNTFLHDVELGADGDLLERHRHLHFARQIGVVELVRVAQALAGHELQIFSAERMALARGEIAK